MEMRYRNANPISHRSDKVSTKIVPISGGNPEIYYVFFVFLSDIQLLACRDILGRTTIEARVVNVASIVEGEYAENVIRKDFAPSERYAIGKALAAEIGNRQGQRTDRELVHNGTQVDKGSKTRDIVAQKSGLGSHASYERVGKVIDDGVPELVDAMDKKEISIRKAAEIAKLPPEETCGV